MGPEDHQQARLVRAWLVRQDKCVVGVPEQLFETLAERKIRVICRYHFIDPIKTLNLQAGEKRNLIEDSRQRNALSVHAEPHPHPSHVEGSLRRSKGATGE